MNGRELRCKVFAEGRQPRLHAVGAHRVRACGGGRIYTDAIDNSAGVDTSDHEVNIKILLGLAIAEGELTEKQRNAVLAGNDRRRGAASCCATTIFQTQVLSVTGRIAPQLLDAQGALHAVPGEGRAAQPRDRVPARPTRRSPSAARNGPGLTSPERAVLLAYSKIWLYDELLASAAARRSVGRRRR